MFEKGLEFFKSFIGEEVAPKKTDNDVLDYYERLMKKGEIIENVSFSQSELKEGIFFYKDDVKVSLPLTEMYRSARQKGTGFVNKKALERTYPCIVKKVDRKNKAVTLSMLDAQDKVKPMAIEKIDKALSKGEKLIVPARVIYIPTGTGTNVYLDIFGLGIKGKLSRENWADTYTPDLKLVCKVNDVLNVAIIGKSRTLVDGELPYECSRAATLPESAWASIEEKAPVGSVVVVRCLKKESKNFIGTVEGLNNVNAFCFYPERDTGIVIKEGRKYRGFVSHCNGEKKVFRCRILAEIDNN